MISKIDLDTLRDKVDASMVYELMRKIPEIKANNGYLYIHNEVQHYWERINRKREVQAIRSLFSDDSQSLLSMSIISEVIKRIKSSPEFQVDFDSYRKPWLINVKNGLYNIHTKQLEKYNMDNYFTYFVNINYKEKSKINYCHEFLKFVKSSLDTDVGDSKLNQLLEMLAYLISDLQGAKLAFFFIGKGNSGKSVLLNLLRYVIGETFCSTVAFDKLTSRFNIAELYGNRVNICAEVSCKKIQSPDIFKQIVSHDIVMAEKKGKNPFSFRIDAKLITAGNVLPRFSNVDGTNAIADRMLILKFNKSIPKKDWIPDLEKRLIEESDRIFSVAIDKLGDLQQRNFVFNMAQDSNDTIDEYRNSQNSFDEFIKDCCTINEDVRSHKYKMWEAYQKYCCDNCYDLLLDHLMFSDKVISLPGVHPSKFRLQGTSRAGYIGIAPASICEKNIFQDS